MSIWGRRDGEPSAEEDQAAEAQDVQEPAAGYQDAAAHQDGEPAPARTGVVVDGESAVKDPALTGTAGAQAEADGEQARPHGAEAGAAGAQARAYGAEARATGVQEPTVAVAREPAVNEAEQSLSSGTQPSATGAGWPPPGGAGQQPVAGTTGAGQPPAGGAEQPAVASGTVDSAGSSDPDSPGGISPQRWSEILVGFVDDPRGSVKMAADAVDEAIDGFVNSVRDRQRDLASSWQGPQADTEQLRTALREYRRLGQRVQQLDLGEKADG